MIALGGLLLIAGCGTILPRLPSERPPAGTPRTPADRRAALPSALSTERQWLQSWFDGTPVLIVQRGDGAVAVDVPSEHCFEVGQSRVKPALAAVLDKVAESLLRVDDARLTVVAAPSDAKSRPSLALRRAEQVRRHLRSRGVAAARLGPAMESRIDAVQLRIDTDVN